MKNQFLTLTLAVGAMLIVAQGAQAQQRVNCGDRIAIVDRLANKYGETRQSIGLGANNAVVEVFASQTSGTWTITVTMANGKTCLVASGQAFETMNEDLASLTGDEV
ncbi:MULTISPECIES: hypothetical protein [Falsihalocynthiibacter]|uniref:hypothetical protein n=1 Tax=Falsihalocynthiibacter TaxID=2854182 RepID=UPI003003547F